MSDTKIMNLKTKINDLTKELVNARSTIRAYENLDLSQKRLINRLTKENDELILLLDKKIKGAIKNENKNNV